VSRSCRLVLVDLGVVWLYDGAGGAVGLVSCSMLMELFGKGCFREDVGLGVGGVLFGVVVCPS